MKFINVESIIGPNGKDVSKITRKSDGVILWDKRKWVIKDGKLLSDWKDPTGSGLAYFMMARARRWSTASPTKDDSYWTAIPTVTQKDGYVEIKYLNLGTNPLNKGEQIALIGGTGEGNNGLLRRIQFECVLGNLLSGTTSYFSNITIKVLTGSTVTGSMTAVVPNDGYSWTIFNELKTYNVYKTDKFTYSLSADHTLSGANPVLVSNVPWWHANCTTQLSNINKTVGNGILNATLQMYWFNITMNVKELYYYE